MTMYDLESLSQLANNFYQKGLAPVSGRELPDVPVTPDWNMAGPQKTSAIKPDPAAEPGLGPAYDYYFLRDSTASNTALSSIHSVGPRYDAEKVRRDFPILERPVNGHPLIWFDNAATTQKPLPVINALSQFYREYNSNVHRGAHTLANRATEAYETAREKVQQLIGAPSAAEIIFVRGTTEAINLVAQSYGKIHIGKGDEILISVMEHHSNIIPWQLLCQQTGAIIRPIPINDQGEIILGEYEKLLSRRTRLVAITQVSNVLGTINPVRLMTQMAHYFGARVIIDGAQAVPHFTVDVKTLDADFYVFSGHKVYGPTGIGVLYGKRNLLEEMPPWQGGGGMIQQVSFEETTFNSLPHKFEAGTVNIADAVGLGSAIDYLRKTDLVHIERYEQELTGYAMDKLSRIPDLRLFGTAPHKIAVISFLIMNVSPDELARKLDQHGIAVRTGHHCAQPLMRHYGQKGMLRASFGLYNTREEVDKLEKIIRQTVRNQ
jgi:cysteine desulfurase/selenocysteine lyase